MSRFKAYLRRLEIRFLTPFTGNTLGFKTNLRWKYYALECKKNYNETASFASISIAREIKRDGLAVIGRVDVDSLLNESTKYFGNEAKLYQQMHQKNQAQLATQIYDVLTQVKEPVEAYFGSHFRPYWISIQKTMPGKVDIASSFGWHTDDNPKEMIKIFIYLNDVKESNGAFRAFPWNTTKQLLARGFRSFDNESRTKNHGWIEFFLSHNQHKLKILEGESGTVLAFDNNLVHKGTAPQQGFRIAIQIPVIPAKEQFALSDIERALLSSRKRDFPSVPGSDDFGD